MKSWALYLVCFFGVLLVFHIAIWTKWFIHRLLLGAKPRQRVNSEKWRFAVRLVEKKLNTYAFYVAAYIVLTIIAMFLYMHTIG